jgi:hypothetical protein
VSAAYVHVSMRKDYEIHRNCQRLHVHMLGHLRKSASFSHMLTASINLCFEQTVHIERTGRH